MELRYFKEATLKGFREYFEMGTDRERCIRTEPSFLACVAEIDSSGSSH